MEPEGVGWRVAVEIVAPLHFTVVTRQTFTSTSLDK
jgi:hypothetical protein